MTGAEKRELAMRRIMEVVKERVNAMLDYVEQHPKASLAEWEGKVSELGRGCFGVVLEVAIEGRRQVEEEGLRCQCGGQLRYKGEQRRKQETLVGEVRWRRGYYYCQACGQGRYPMDQSLGVAGGQFSEGVQEKAARLGVTLPFREAAQELDELMGISMSARELARITEGRGRILEEKEARQREELLEDRGPVRGSRRSLLGGRSWAVALDAGKVRFEDGWHEVKAGSVFWVEAGAAQGKPRAREQSYIAQVGSMEQAGERLYAEVIRRGVDPGVDRLVCLGDGAPGIWNQYALHFPHRVEILDWYHACEHLWAAGNGVFGEGTEAAKSWVEAQKGLLWEGKVEEVVASLEALSQGPGGEAAREQIHYFQSNQERMRYGQFRAQGYPIGSGSVESACKRVIGARLKGSGMCWGEDGAQYVLALRTAKLSNRWDEAWQATRPAPLPMAA